MTRTLAREAAVTRHRSRTPNAECPATPATRTAKPRGPFPGNAYGGAGIPGSAVRNHHVSDE
ncbi:hypothetical protein [Sinosporangium siamense]|uniref:Uncharacterized protein n=1 Tax=Sinosporangium siamense TaxID=1367973 RepID=A0A919RHF7_9ACTN|nr:hypothetical protein [Sinosporangium siamense]GII93913.1 hypothetical protein Ssi02_41440 [Sinosporangium siamense]